MTELYKIRTLINNENIWKKSYYHKKYDSSNFNKKLLGNWKRLTSFIYIIMGLLIKILMTIILNKFLIYIKHIIFICIYFFIIDIVKVWKIYNIIKIWNYGINKEKKKKDLKWAYLIIFTF